VIFGYSLAESKKFVIAAITFIGAIVAMFVAYNPGINESAITLAGAVFGVAGVFMAPQFSVEDLSKSLVALQGAAIAMANFWVTVSPSVTVKITTAVGAIVALIALYVANNEKPHNVASAAADIQSARKQ
jgi:hypothetical protein